jgi:hypothetical protein
MEKDETVLFQKYQLELNELRETITQLAEQNRILTEQQSFLKERINRLSPESNEEYVTRRSDISEQLVETIIGMLARVKMPLTLRAICDLLKGSNVVPVQILNVPIYVTRRLEKAVILGRIRFQLHGDDDKKRYSLPEWYEGEELLDAFKIR